MTSLRSYTKLRTPRDESGFTLLEVLIALVIVGAAMASLLALLSASYRQTGHLDEVFQAWRLGDRVLMEGLLFPSDGVADSGEEGEYHWRRALVFDQKTNKPLLEVVVSWEGYLKGNHRVYRVPVPPEYQNLP